MMNANNPSTVTAFECSNVVVIVDSISTDNQFQMWFLICSRRSHPRMSQWGWL